MLLKVGKKKNAKTHLTQRDHKVKIYDIADRTVELDMIVQNKLLTGLLVSGYYNLLAGHIYFGSNVIKVRYDLLKEKGKKYGENDIFDTYQDILKLRPGCKVDTSTTLVSSKGHRFGFLQQDL